MCLLPEDVEQIYEEARTAYKTLQEKRGDAEGSDKGASIEEAATIAEIPQDEYQSWLVYQRNSARRVIRHFFRLLDCWTLEVHDREYSNGLTISSTIRNLMNSTTITINL